MYRGIEKFLEIIINRKYINSTQNHFPTYLNDTCLCDITKFHKLPKLEEGYCA